MIAIHTWKMDVPARALLKMVLLATPHLRLRRVQASASPLSPFSPLKIVGMEYSMSEKSAIQAF
jgi:hypothetical protein